MREQSLEISGADGEAEAFLYTPAEKGSWPGVIFFTDVFGIRPVNQEMARRIAAQGYAVLMPNIFYRTDRLPVMDFAFQRGEERSMKRLGELLGALPAHLMKRDVVAFANTLLTQDGVSGNRVAVVGYCFSGKMALFAAAEAPDKVVAAASFHGGGLVTEAPDSPHSLIPKVQGELYFGHAVEDQSMTPQQIEKLDLTLKAWGGAYQSEIYEGALHGWTVPGRDIYNEIQAERHYEKLFDLLKRTLR